MSSLAILEVVDPPLATLATKPHTEMQVRIKPYLESYDSGEECSLSHLVQLYELVEIEDQKPNCCAFDGF